MYSIQQYVWYLYRWKVHYYNNLVVIIIVIIIVMGYSQLSLSSQLVEDCD